MNDRRFVDSVRNALLAARIDLNCPLVGAVSGGADSMALIEALREICMAGELEVVAAHFNHGLRGAESDGDQAFVVDWCATNEVRYVTGRAEGPWPPDLSPEAAARLARYSFLARVLKDVAGSAVVTGHTLDDQAETVLLHLARGSGIAGLQGMRLVSGLPIERHTRPLTVVRPLLNLRHSDTVAFCRSRGIDPRHDSSNDDRTVPRNRVRHEVLPSLRAVNPGALEAIARLADAARDDLDFVSRHATDAWEDVRQDAPPGSARVSRSKFRVLHPALKRRVLMRIHADLAGDASGLSLDHVDGMLALAEGRSGTSLDLPGGLRFEVGYRNLNLRCAGAAADADCPFPQAVATTTLKIPGSAGLGAGFSIRADVLNEFDSSRASRWTAYFDPDCMGGQAVIRSRKRGDRFRPSGMPVDKKLQDFFVDARVPRTWRDRVPLVVTDRGIAWVVGYRIADWARARGAGGAVRLKAVPGRDVESEDSN